MDALECSYPSHGLTGPTYLFRIVLVQITDADEQVPMDSYYRVKTPLGMKVRLVDADKVHILLRERLNVQASSVQYLI